VTDIDDAALNRDLDALTRRARTDRSAGLGARVLAEAVGTGLLVCAVVGSGVAAQRLSPGDVGLQLLENAVATGTALAVLIVVLQPVSAAFNPVVTVMERALGVIGTRQAVASVAAQVAGGVAGAVLANLMFDESAVKISSTVRSGPGLWLRWLPPPAWS
jgi:glycerol uptake facilitator-like aquaporin